MVINRPRTAREILSKAGLWPKVALAAAALSLLTLPSTVLARQQGTAPVPAAAAPAQPRDPMKTAPRDSKDAKVVVSEHMTVDLHVKDEDLSNVLELLSIQTQKNIIASKGVSGKVTATLYGVTFYQALDAILHVNGFGYMENGNFIYVYTQDELKQIQQALKKRVTKVIRLNYLNADDAKEFVTPLLSKDGGEIKINMKPADFTIPEKSPVGKNSYALSDTVVVIDYEENVKAIEELVKQIDTRPAQVLVEATILQTTLNEANAFGVDFSIIGDLNFLDFINTGGALSAANALIAGGTGAAKQGISPADNKGSAVTSTVGNTGGPGGFKVGVVSGDVAIFVRMLDEVTDTVTLSNPKILALNRQPARVLVGKRVGYLSTTSTDTSTTQSIEFLDTGTQLYFRPFVSSEGEIRMELKPQVSSAEIRRLTDVSGKIVTVPDENTQELVTNVNVRDGQTIVLGGLFSENSSFTRRQVPWVGDLPIIGAAFRGHEDSTVRSEIIFLITPSIVTDAMVASSASHALDQMEYVRAGQRQGLLPFSREKMTDKLNVEAEQLAREGKYDQALWDIKRSLSLNPYQPQAYQLREKITNQREQWPNRSMLDEIIGDETGRGVSSVKPSPSPEPFYKPNGSVEIPLMPLNQRPTSEGGRSLHEKLLPVNPTQQAARPATPIALPSANSTLMQQSSEQTASTGAESNRTQMVDGQPVEYTVATSAGGTTPATGESTAQTAALENALESQPGAKPNGYTPPTLSESEKLTVTTVRSVLPTLRAQVDMYANMNSGELPKLGTGQQFGWSELVGANVMAQPPKNDYVGGVNAQKVVVGDKPDTRFHSDYGWIYNPATGQLWAAGFDASDRPIDKATAQQPNPARQPTQQQADVPTPLSFHDDNGPQDPWSMWFGLSPSEWVKMVGEMPTTRQAQQPVKSEPGHRHADPDTNK